MLRLKVRERIGQEYLQWNKGDVITITAGTGKGKSHFIKNEIYDKAKSEGEQILFFIHRANTKKQFNLESNEEGKDDCITYKTYQAYQNSLISKEAFDLNKYKYIVCDEYHYFSNDSGFNKFTDIALNSILSQRKEAILILMSATNGFINTYLENDLQVETKHYRIPISYDFIEEIDFFIQESELIQILEHQLKKGAKTIVFIDSAERCYKFFEKYQKSSMFVCSDSNKTYAKKMDITKRNELIKNNKFTDTFLFTTNTLDAGLNINDDELDSIVLDVADTDTLIQCIGRKRLSENSNKLKLLIKNRIAGILNDDLKSIRRKMIHVDFLKFNGQQEYSKKYYREPDPSQIVYYEPNHDGCFEIRVNELTYKYLAHRKEIINTIRGLPNGYMQYIDELFGREKDSLLHDRYLGKAASELLSYYYENNISIEHGEKKEFAKKLNVSNGRDYAKTIKTINRVLKRKLTTFYFVEEDTRKEGKGDKRAWKVKAVVKNKN